MKPVETPGFRWRLWLAVLIALLIVGYFVVRSPHERRTLPATTEIKRGEIESLVLATGTLQA